MWNGCRTTVREQARSGAWRAANCGTASAAHWGLTPRERTVFELKHYHGLRLRTVAGMLNTTEGTIKNTLFRATHKLRVELAEVR